jgi:hypothetical protein
VYSFKLGSGGIVVGGVACGAFHGAEQPMLACAASGGRVLLQSQHQQAASLSFGKEVSLISAV